MRQQRFSGWVVTILGLSLAGSSLPAAQTAPPPVPAQEQPEVLTRGPVHEAFAEPVNFEYQEGLVAPSQPPANIEEIPPADRPEGDQFVWVPGYWSWDGERNNYIWVSACWRVAPPDMSWVPGYWAPGAGGWEWVAGFWAPAGAEDIEYLPAPPASDAVGPPSPPPSANHIWVPPCHYWSRDRYTRRPGYWLMAQPGWVWAPSHYVRTPRGYIFCAGHWDYALEDRGVLFAPVYFPRSVYARAAFTYSPTIVVELGGLTASLFAYPRYSHYYFGDYYDDAYIRIGIYPWFEAERMRTWYDPIYQYDRWHHRRTEPRWEERERHDYDLRRADKDLRPARTYREMETRLAKLDEPRRRNLRMAQPLTTVVASKTTTLKFEQVTTVARQKIAKQATEVSKFREQRTQWESRPADRRASQVPAERRDTVAPPIERKQPVTPPTERRQPVTPPTVREQPATPPTEAKQPVRPPTERKVAPVAPREAEAPRTERVRIPAGPIVGKRTAPGAVGKGPPVRPADEHKAPAEGKDTRRDEAKDAKDKSGKDKSN